MKSSWQASFSEHISRYCTKYQYFFPSYCWIIFYYMIMCARTHTHTHITLCLSIHQTTDIWVVSTSWLVWTVLLWIFIGKFLCGHIFSLLLAIYLWEELLAYIVTVFNVECWSFEATPLAPTKGKNLSKVFRFVLKMLIHC